MANFVELDRLGAGHTRVGSQMPNVQRASRLIASCCAVLASACGAGDDRLDPSDLDLRDLLGVSPEIASTWDAGQRAAARRVIEDGLRSAEAAPIRASLATGGAPDQWIATALASADAHRAKHGAPALGLVRIATGAGEVLATTRVATLEPHAGNVDIQLAGWEAYPQLPARGTDVLAALANDAGHRDGPIVVAPAPHLAVVAAYAPTPPRLVVNPVVLAALEPGAAVRSGTTTATTTAAAFSIARSAPPPPTAPAFPTATADGTGNPYSFYGSVAECASAQRARCEACLPTTSCAAITSSGDGNAECTQFADNGGRDYYLICVNLALAIQSVASCTTSAAPTCAFDPHAVDSLGSIEANASFLDNPACGGPLDACLASIYGASNGTYPPPGSDAGAGTPPRNTSIDCSNSCSGDSNCDVDPSCELDGPSCDDSTSCDGGCADSNDQSSCSSDSGGGGGDCGGNEDACGSDNTSGCGDCSGGDSGGDCGGGGGGDCGGGGGDCGGGGGDCGGGGGDCNAGKHRGARGNLTIFWAFLPLPFAVIARRRAERRRARMELDE